MDDLRRELVETHEFTAQLEDILKRHSRDVLLPVFSGLFESIAMNPSAFPQTVWGARLARNDPAGLTIPTFRVVFQILDEGQATEHVLLLWIQEDSTFDEISGLLM